MYGVNVKRNLIIALIFGLSGVVMLFLKVIKVLPDDNLYTLISIVLLLFGFVFYLRPKKNIMKNKSQYLIKYREGFYNELTKQNKNLNELKEITFNEKEDGVIYYNNFAFAGLNRKEFSVIAQEMLKDFVMICFGEGDEKSNKAKIESLSVKLVLNDGRELKSKLIEEYKII